MHNISPCKHFTLHCIFHPHRGQASYAPCSQAGVSMPLNTLWDARILSAITEHTENQSSRPMSYNLSATGSRPVSDAIRHYAVSLHSRGDKSSLSDNSSRPYSPLMVIEGQVQCLQVLAHLVPTRKPVNQYLLSLQHTGMGAPTLAHPSPTKAGHLSRDLTHLAPRHIPSFPHHPIAILRGLTLLGLKVPTCQAKLLPTQTNSLLPRIVLPIPASQLKVLH